MDTLLENGTQKVDSAGYPITVVGNEEVIQQALIRLGVKRGSLCYDPTLGSRLHSLEQGGKEETDRLALGYAREALKEMPQITVREVHCDFLSGEQLLVYATLEYDRKTFKLEVDSNRFL